LRIYDPSIKEQECIVPKMKTRRAVAKRFKVTASGKLKRKRQGLRHILEKRSQKSKKKAGMTDYVHTSDMRQAMRCLPGY
jgi:large subunit ribosomal protein L35